MLNLSQELYSIPHRRKSYLSDQYRLLLSARLLVITRRNTAFFCTSLQNKRTQKGEFSACGDCENEKETAKIAVSFTS